MIADWKTEREVNMKSPIETQVALPGLALIAGARAPLSIPYR